MQERKQVTDKRNYKIYENLGKHESRAAYFIFLKKSITLKRINTVSIYKLHVFNEICTNGRVCFRMGKYFA